MTEAEQPHPVAGIPPGGTATRARLRIRFSKLGKIRWTSHRDVARMWERALRRVDLPVAYSQGFSPRPRISFGLALPTGCESLAEYLDVDLEGAASVDPSDLAGGLSSALPGGVDVMGVAVLAPGSPSLQEDVETCTWRWLASGLEDPAARVRAILDAPALDVLRSRKGGLVTEDVRPGIVSVGLVETEGTGGSVGIECELRCKPRSVRPADVASCLGPGVEAREVRRTHQWILREGARREPLPAAAVTATDAPRALVRAS